MKTNKIMKAISPISSDFNPLLCPPYQAATVGKWRLFSAATIPVPVAGYFTVHAPMPAEYWVLEKNAVVWMSLTPMEMESQGHHARLATGHVVVMGLGMGALVYNLLLNPLVTRITVCELEPDVVSLLKMAAPCRTHSSLISGPRWDHAARRTRSKSKPMSTPARSAGGARKFPMVAGWPKPSPQNNRRCATRDKLPPMSNTSASSCWALSIKITRP